MNQQWPQLMARISQQAAAGELEQLGHLFDLLLTEEERQTISTRLMVFRCLDSGEMSQRQIAGHCQVSIATVTRCANYLKQMTKEQRAAVSALVQPVTLA